MTPTVLTTCISVRLRRERSSLRAALAVPQEDSGPYPGMIVLHELYGLNDDMRRIAGRFAAEGYITVAPDLYSYANRGICLARALIEAAAGRLGRVGDHIEATRRFLLERPDVDRDRIGVAGFCMGGGFALLFATRGTVATAAVNYGPVPKSRWRLEGICPVVASYGGKDRVYASHGPRLESHLEALGVPHDVQVYEDVGHSFLSFDNEPTWMKHIPLPNPMHVGYDEAAASDSWKRMLAFFGEHLR